jgi:hypothetical protein
MMLKNDRVAERTSMLSHSRPSLKLAYEKTLHGAIFLRCVLLSSKIAKKGPQPQLRHPSKRVHDETKCPVKRRISFIVGPELWCCGFEMQLEVALVELVSHRR